MKQFSRPRTSVFTALDGYEAFGRSRLFTWTSASRPSSSGLVASSDHRSAQKMAQIAYWSSPVTSMRISNPNCWLSVAQILRNPSRIRSSPRVLEESEPARRICVLSEEPDCLKPFIKKLEDLISRGESLAIRLGAVSYSPSPL